MVIERQGDEVFERLPGERDADEVGTDRNDPCNLYFPPLYFMTNALDAPSAGNYFHFSPQMVDNVIYYAKTS
jgi:hypothetical protein